MKKTFILLIMLSLFTGCKEDVGQDPASQAWFDEQKWKTREGKDYPFRKEMLGDLMNNRNLRNLKRGEILDLLGEPTRIDTNYLFYQIEQKRLGLFPIHTTTMVIELSEDGTVNWIKIHK